MLGAIPGQRIIHRYQDELRGDRERGGARDGGHAGFCSEQFDRAVRYDLEDRGFDSIRPADLENGWGWLQSGEAFG